jgi:hypothetical protein
MIRRPETSVLLLLPCLGGAFGCTQLHENAASQGAAMATVCEADPEPEGCPGGGVAEGSECCVYAIAGGTDALDAIQKTCAPAPVADAGTPTPTPTPDEDATAPVVAEAAAN